MQSMLLSALLLLPMLCAANLGKQRQDPTVTNTLHRVVGSLVHQDAGTLKQVAAEKQAMKVINVGLARTGTSSFVTATAWPHELPYEGWCSGHPGTFQSLDCSR